MAITISGERIGHRIGLSIAFSLDGCVGRTLRSLVGTVFIVQ